MHFQENARNLWMSTTIPEEDRSSTHPFLYCGVSVLSIYLSEVIYI